MITANVIQRTFQIRFNGSTATGFVIDFDDRQYMVTAKHVLGDITGSVAIEIFHAHEWKALPARVVGHAQFDADLSVIALPQILANKDLTLPIAENYAYGQDVYFLGFPFGLYGDIGSINQDYPFPFVKRAIISSFSEGGRPAIVYLDGYNNPGFSGGPVVMKNPKTNAFEVVSVISGYRFNQESVFVSDESPAVAFIKANTGIISSVGIRHAFEIAAENPIGCPNP